MACKYCGKKVTLVPSAEERARKTGESASYYKSLFPNHADCEIASRDGKPNPFNGLFFKYSCDNYNAVLLSCDSINGEYKPHKLNKKA